MSLTDFYHLHANETIFALKNKVWLLIFILLLTSLIFDRVLKVKAIQIFKKVFNLESSNYNQHIDKLSFPLSLIFIPTIWKIFFNFIKINEAIETTSISILNVILAFGIMRVSLIATDLVSSFLIKKAELTETKFDDILIPLVQKSFKTVIFIFTIVFIGNSFNIDMKGLLAGLGIGGMAIAFAAKDSLSNLFGSFTVLFDRPFTIGDWVVIDGDIEGTVELVGLRSTRIRTFYDSQISVPNSMLTNLRIDNFGKRKYRRLNTSLDIAYDTPPEKIEAFCEGIRQLILSQENTRKDYFNVYLNGLGSHSLKILLYCFWEASDWSEELTLKHQLFIDILRLGKNLEVEFAFPTQTLHLFQEKEKEVCKVEKTGHLEFGASKAKDIINSPLAINKPRSNAKDF